jgi:uroporphyrinogen decarboxylase
LTLPVEAWSDLPQPDPYTDGLMALTLHRYWNLEHNGELPEPHRIRFVAARGPFAIAAHLVGAHAFLNALADEDLARHALDMLDSLVETTIRYLQAQLGCLRGPVGIMMLDDITGMLPSSQFEQLAIPYLRRVFDSFDGLVRIYHNSTPCVHLLPAIAHLNFEVFHFSHQMDIRSVRAALAPKAVMGNLPPLGTLAHGSPEQVVDAALRCLDSLTDYAGVILSAGGSVHPDTPPENIDALLEATRL